jgi:hypothetical protein
VCGYGYGYGFMGFGFETLLLNLTYSLIYVVTCVMSDGDDDMMMIVCVNSVRMDQHKDKV